MVHTIRMKRGIKYVNRVNDGPETRHDRAQSIDLARGLGSIGEAGKAEQSVIS